MDTEAVLDLLIEVAETHVNPRFRALALGDVDQKKPGDFVTIADRESEAALTKVLSAAYPGALIVGEEAAFENPDLLARLAAAEHAFVIDPVDGTANFVHGSPDHAVMVGELLRGDPVRGWIWHPQHQVSWVGEKGAGVRRNGEPVTRHPEPGRVLGRTSLRRLIGAADSTLTQPVVRSRMAAGIDYPDLIAGDIDFLVYGPPKPWDHVPAVVMLREFGCVLRFPDGTDYGVGVPGSRVVAAGDEQTWRAADVLAARLLA